MQLLSRVPSRPSSLLLREVRCFAKPPQRCISTTASRSATPLPHPPAPGPPPKAPTPSAAYLDNRVQRKKKQAELLKRGQELRANPAKPTSVLKKRFWKNVNVVETDDGYTILLDTRPVRTAQKHVLTIPRKKPQLATAIAIEWDLLVSTQQALKHHYIPLTSLTARAQDIHQADLHEDPRIREQIVAMAERYLATDTLLCWAPEKNYHDTLTLERTSDRPQTLRELQQEKAQPILDHLTTHIWPGVELVPTLEPDSILPTPQPAATSAKIREWVRKLPAWDLAGLERGIIATKSLLVATRLLCAWSPNTSRPSADAPNFNIEDAAEACNLEVIWQTRMWGEVEDTHDVEKEDIRRQLGSIILLVNMH